MKPSFVLVPLFGMAIALGCSTPDKATGSGASATATSAGPGATAGSTAPSGSGSPSSLGVVATVKDGLIRGELREGSSCAGIGDPLSTSDLTVKGQTVVQTFKTGCGCPSGAHYTLLYAAKTSPLAVRLCFGPGKDLCEMVCSGTLTWDLSAQMKEAGASDIALTR